LFAIQKSIGAFVQKQLRVPALSWDWCENGRS